VTGVLALIGAVVGLVQLPSLPAKMDDLIAKVDADPNMPADQKTFLKDLFTQVKDAAQGPVMPVAYVASMICAAIVILGGVFAVTAAGKLNLASSLLIRGVAAIVEAYLIYWSVVYLIARTWFGFSREWAAPLASGISICGVSAAIATGSVTVAPAVISAQSTLPRYSPSRRLSTVSRSGAVAPCQ